MNDVAEDASARGGMDIPVRLYDEATALLRALGGPDGVRASSSRTANYAAVFTRDAVMAGIAGLLSGDAVITSGFVHTLEHLRGLQGSRGQIASNYLPGEGRASFGTVVPRLDAPLWYLIGIALGARAGVVDAEPYRASATRVVEMLDALEYNGRHLLYVPAGGDWADEYVYEGYILHDQVLRAWALRLAGEAWHEPAWVAASHAIEAAIVNAFWTDDAARRGWPLAAFTPTREYDMFDLATCSLLGVSGIAPAMGTAALETVIARWLANGALPPAFTPVIDESHPDWSALSRYHLHGFRNRPNEYHNGGIWMIWLGWLALALARTGRTDALDRLHRAVGARLSSGAYAFEEYFHGETLAAGGTAGMAYSATGLLFLRAASHARLDLLAP